MYKIPESGILFVKSTRPFEVWHAQTAEFGDGTPLATDMGPADDFVGPPEEVKLWGPCGGTDGSGTFFVGREDGFVKAIEDRLLGKSTRKVSTNDESVSPGRDERGE